jgi:hypothetical protein
MSQNSPIDSGIQLSKTTGLKPALAAALASLEVQLDQELARYRRARIASKTAHQPRTGVYISSLAQEAKEMTALAGLRLPIAEVKTNVPPASIPEASLEKPAPATAKIEEGHQVQQPPSTDSLQEAHIPLPSPQSTGSIVPATAKAAQGENLVQRNETPTHPDDYLESSEALLRSLTDEQQQTKPPSNYNDSLLSPLGIGSMLLLLMASLTLGYVVFNPKSLPQLSLDKIFNNNSASNSNSTETQGFEPTSQPAAEKQLTPIPKYPNLAAQEFPEVKDPNDIVGLQPKLQSTPVAPVNQPVVIPTPTTPPVASPLPELQTVQPVQPLNLPSIATATPLAQPATTAPQVNAEITPAADGFYHIVTDNQDASSIVSARQIVPDAYLSSDQRLIFLGALKTKEQVQQRLQELQTQGLRARVQQP